MNFLWLEDFLALAAAPNPLRAPLPWRMDGAPLRPEVQRLALEFGYPH